MLVLRFFYEAFSYFLRTLYIYIFKKTKNKRILSESKSIRGGGEKYEKE
jgi:hypothetical protein